MSRRLDVDHVSRVVRALLVDAGREVLLEDRANRDIVPIPFDSAAAVDGLLPVFLSAGEALWRDVTGGGFGLELTRDLGALLSWRVKAIASAQLRRRRRRARA
jgi:hypothetical protein